MGCDHRDVINDSKIPRIPRICNARSAAVPGVMSVFVMTKISWA
jgi:hypothetical protein